MPVTNCDTLLVLGAGASIEFGFPSGAEMVRTLARDLSVVGSATHECLLACGYPKTLIDEFQTALVLARPPSVDMLLERRPEFLAIGKACIAAVLIPWEIPERLFRPEPSWYDELLGRLDNGPFDGFKSNRLTIVTFNYDRSLEYFLVTALRNRWNLTTEKCAALLNTAVPIVHIYGQLGTLPELGGAGGRPYGPALEVAAVQAAAAEIHILHEGGSSKYLTVARMFGDKAERICFLGFGYHSTNVERLGVANVRNRSISGTAFGLLETERALVCQMFGGDTRIALGRPDDDIRKYLRTTPILT